MALSKVHAKSKTARRRGPRPGQPQIPGTGDLRAVLRQRNRLFAEARRNPDSEAAQMVQMFTLSGMLAGQAGAAAAIPADPTRTALERMVLEQGGRLDAVAEAAEQAKAEQWDETAIYNRIVDIVGLRAPLQMRHESEEQDRRESQPQGVEDICRTQPLQDPKS